MVDVALWSLVVYAVLLVVGGILGYVLPEKPSKISLVMGVASGVLCLVAFLVGRKDEPLPGLAMGIVVALGVGYMMWMRFRQTRKFMPSGLVAAASVIVAVLSVAALCVL